MPEHREMLRSSLEILGDIAVIKLQTKLESSGTEIAHAIMKKNKGIKVVLQQIGPVKDEFRLRPVRWIAGEKRTSTIHREHGCSFRVDLTKSYFSPRLQTEHLRIARLVANGEIIVNMFAGVGGFSIIIAKKAQPARIFSIDSNEEAVELHKQNVRDNHIDNIEVIHADAAKGMSKLLQEKIDRVLMPLPEKALEYLGVALSFLKKQGGSINLYDFVSANQSSEAIEKTRDKLTTRLYDCGRSFSMERVRIVRSVGPSRFQTVADISFGKS
ncbi:MAG: class I SAM-dependent methyltransferase family protein [Candidatus Bathyarchaeia archaeon]